MLELTMLKILTYELFEKIEWRIIQQFRKTGDGEGLKNKKAPASFLNLQRLSYML